MGRQERKLKPDKGGPMKEADAKMTAVADWLRNEKKSGLNTKEAVQYEKVRCLL